MWKASGVVFFLSISSLAASNSKVTLDEAFKSALQKTETMAIEERRLNQAEARIDEAKGKIFPKIAAVGTYTRQDDSIVKTTPDQSIGKLTLSQPLYHGGQDSAAREIAELGKKAQQQSVYLARQTLYANVAHRFYDVQLNEQDMQNLKDTINLTEKRIIELQRRTKIGRSRRGEVLTAQAQMAVLYSQLEAARGLASTARDQFAFATGLTRDSELLRTAQEPPPLRGIDAYLAVIEKRPDIEALKAQLKAAQEGVSFAKGGHFPQLDLSGNYYFLRTGASENIKWDAMLGLTLPLFEGGSTQAAVREASEREMEVELQLHQRRRQAESEVRSSYSNLTSLLEQRRTLEKALVDTERNYVEQTKDYRYSLVTNLDVFQALNTFQDTKRALDRAKFQALASWADLRASVGQVP
jgi:outer membrane protein